MEAWTDRRHYVCNWQAGTHACPAPATPPHTHANPRRLGHCAIIELVKVICLTKRFKRNVEIQIKSCWNLVPNA